jgi:hypothetical protein
MNFVIPICFGSCCFAINDFENDFGFELRIVFEALVAHALILLMAAQICYDRDIEWEVFMTLAIVSEAAPLKANDEGVILVGQTRITLDTVVAVFMQGITAEEIVYRYPSLNLAGDNRGVCFKQG